MSNENIKNTYSKSPNKIRENLKVLLNHKKTVSLLGKDVVNILDSKINKENLNLELKKDLNYYSNLAKQKEENFNIVANLTKEIIQNLNCAIDYQNYLNEIFHDFVLEINEYERQIAELIKEKNNIIFSSNELLKEKVIENQSLKNNINDIENKINNISTEVNDLSEKLKNLTEDKENEEKKFLKIESEQVEKYNKVFTKYKSMLNKYNIYENDEIENEQNEKLSNKLTFENNVEKENLKMKIYEAKLHNEMLQKNLETLNNKINLLSCNNEFNYKKDKFNPKSKRMSTTSTGLYSFKNTITHGSQSVSGKKI